MTRMDDFKAKHDEYKCLAGCCHAQPNKVARARMRRELLRELTRLTEEFDGYARQEAIERAKDEY